MTNSKDMAVDDSGAAVVCSHVAEEGKPILLATRDAPVDPVDSGWQFLCGAAEEDTERARVWSIRSVLKEDPSLLPFVEKPPGTMLRRRSTNSPWSEGRTDGRAVS